jgi:hypothetical protein
MKTEGMVQEAGTASEAKPDFRAQLARYVAQQPRSRRTFDRVMKVVELAGLAFVAGYLAWAIYVSINWSVAQHIVAVWFGFPASIAALLVLVGLHAAGLRAFLPILLPGSTQGFVTGARAVATGLGFAVTLLLASAFWAAFAWGIWTTNWAILEPLAQLLGVLVGIGIVVAVVSDLYKKLLRSR